MTGGPDRPLSVVHVVVTDGFAGVERYVCQVAGELESARPPAPRHRRRPGAHAIGASRLGPPPAGRPPAVGGGRPGRGRAAPTWSMSHMTTAEGAAWLARPFQRATGGGHPALRRRPGVQPRGHGPWPASPAGSSASDIAISRFVAETITSPSVVIPNGVPARPQAPLVAPTVVMLQRLDTEKAPEVGIRAFALSGLAQQGWRLVVAGQGRARAVTARAGRRAGPGRERGTGRPRGPDRSAPGRVVGAVGAGAPRALRSLGGRGHGPRTPRGGRRSGGPPRDGRRGRAALPSGRRGGRRRRPGGAWAGTSGCAVRSGSHSATGSRTGSPCPGTSTGSSASTASWWTECCSRSSGRVRRRPGTGPSGSPPRSPTSSDRRRRCPPPADCAHRPGSSSSRARAACRASGSRGGTSRPSSPTTSGRAPLALATTGMPDAWASTTTRPNCSSHPGMGTEGTARTSKRR